MVERFKAKVYDYDVDIDLINGSGFSEVLQIMSNFLNSFSKWAKDDSFIDDVDLKQEAYLAAIEGILQFNPDNNTKLSTFIHRFVKNKIINIDKKKYVKVEKNIEPISKMFSLEDKILLNKLTENWSQKDKRIVFRIVIKEDKIRNIAKDENMTPWGLTRRFVRIMKAAKKELETNGKG